MKKSIVAFSFLALIMLIGCSDDTIYKAVNRSNTSNVPNPNIDNQINNFVWKSMNSWYKWQKDVPDLSDNIDDSLSAYNKFLNKELNPEKFFYSLLNNYGKIDRFSWFIEDYEEQRKLFQGISTSYGFKFTLTRIDSNDKSDTAPLIGYVKFVSKNSPADRAGIKRGDIFNAYNNTKFRYDNFRNVLNNTYYSSNLNSLNITFVGKDGKTVIGNKTITKEEVADNPVHLSKVFENVNGKKVGYLVYNGFRSSYNDELNAAFGEFKVKGINELILDFRLNGGGSITTCSFLASMISEEAKEEAFASLIFNDKKKSKNGIYTFKNELSVFGSNGDFIRKEPINRLSGLSRIYILVSKSTASASEMIINGLKPYLGYNNVILVGQKTKGKNVGSITLYDNASYDFRKPSLASKHKYALQPIVLQIYNKDGKSDYTSGFVPDIPVDEYKYWYNILPFGDENEILLKTALNDIKGILARPANNNSNSSFIDTSNFENNLEDQMYLEPYDLENLK